MYGRRFVVSTLDTPPNVPLTSDKPFRIHLLDHSPVRLPASKSSRVCHPLSRGLSRIHALRTAVDVDDLNVWIWCGKSFQVIGIACEANATPGLCGGSDDMCVHHVLGAPVGSGEDASNEPCQRPIGVSDRQTRFPGQAGVDDLIVMTTPIHLGEDDGGYDYLPPATDRGSDCSSHDLLRRGGLAGKRSESGIV